MKTIGKSMDTREKTMNSIEKKAPMKNKQIAPEICGAFEVQRPTVSSVQLDRLKLRLGKAGVLRDALEGE